MEMENQIGVSVFTRNCIRPKLLHKEDLIRKLRWHSISRWSSFPDPISQMSYEIEEEVSFRDGNNFIGDLDEQAKALGRSQIESLRDVLAKVFRSGRRINFECL